MSNPLRSIEDYELFIYTLADRFKTIRQSTLTLVRLGTSLGRVSGEIHFENDYRITVRERLLFDRKPMLIDWYGYEIWRGSDKLFWYDSQPHPDEPRLQSSHPHHKHVPPDIKHNRIPAAHMSFSRPNFDFIIQEVERLISSK